MNRVQIAGTELRMAEGAAVTIPLATNGTLAKILNTHGKTRLCFHFDVATNALDNFDVNVKAHDDATAVDITPANWASLAAGEYRFLYASGNLAAQGAGTSGYFEMDITGLKEIDITASAAVGAASVTPRWSMH